MDDMAGKHRDRLAVLPGVVPAERDELVARIDSALDSSITEKLFRTLEQAVIMAFKCTAASGDDAVHSISNLALLDRNLNSALSNSVFEVKRVELLKHDQAGDYIPACTRNVFLKYYSGMDGQHLHFWGKADRDAYQEKLLAVVGPYLTPSVV